MKRSPPLQRYDLKGHLAFVAYLHHVVERFHETDHMRGLVMPGAAEMVRIATEKNNPFTKFGDTYTQCGGIEKLSDIFKGDQKQRADAIIEIGSWWTQAIRH